MSTVTIDPKVLELGTVLSEGYTSLAAKNRLEKHSRSGSRNRKAQVRAMKRAANEARRDQRWR